MTTIASLLLTTAPGAMAVPGAPQGAAPSLANFLDLLIPDGMAPTKAGTGERQDVAAPGIDLPTDCEDDGATDENALAWLAGTTGTVVPAAPTVIVAEPAAAPIPFAPVTITRAAPSIDASRMPGAAATPVAEPNGTPAAEAAALDRPSTATMPGELPEGIEPAETLAPAAKAAPARASTRGHLRTESSTPLLTDPTADDLVPGARLPAIAQDASTPVPVASSKPAIVTSDVKPRDPRTPVPVPASTTTPPAESIVTAPGVPIEARATKPVAAPLEPRAATPDTAAQPTATSDAAIVASPAAPTTPRVAKTGAAPLVARMPAGEPAVMVDATAAMTLMAEPAVLARGATAQRPAPSAPPTLPSTIEQEAAPAGILPGAPAATAPPVAHIAPSAAGQTARAPLASATPIAATPSPVRTVAASGSEPTALQAAPIAAGTSLPVVQASAMAPAGQPAQADRKADRAATIVPPPPARTPVPEAPATTAAPVIAAAATVRVEGPIVLPTLTPVAADVPPANAAVSPPSAATTDPASLPTLTQPADRTPVVARPSPATPPHVAVQPAPRAEIGAGAAPVIATAARTFADAIHRAVTGDDRPAPADATALATASPAGAITAAAVVPTGHAQQQTLDMAQQRWPEAMIQHIEMLRDMADANDMRIRVIPDALGAIDVSLKRDGDAVQVQLVAEQPQTRAMLAEAQPKLQEMAEARGLKLHQATPGTGAGIAHNAGQNGGRQAPHQHQQRAGHVPAAPPSARRVDDDADNTDQRIA